MGELKTLHYKRSRFVTRLPLDYLYSPSHSWVARHDEGHWRVGLTKFATRMLGEMVDHGFEGEAATPVKIGQVIGWVEGFKAASDLYCVAEGTFAGGNPLLDGDVNLVDTDPYDQGWLYAVNGQPDPQAMDIDQYVNLLDTSIDKMLGQEEPDDTTNEAPPSSQ